MSEATASIPDGIRWLAPLSTPRTWKYFVSLGFYQPRSDLSRHHFMIACAIGASLPIFGHRIVNPPLHCQTCFSCSHAVVGIIFSVVCQYPDTVRRTLQRRIRTWKACHGEELEIMFRQEHKPGLRALSDFTQMKNTVITLNGHPLEHKLFHFRLEWSRWSWVRVVTGGESFTALAERLQEALGQLGGVPQEHRTDSLAAAWKNLSEDDHRDQTEHYAQLCEHYGMTPSRNNPGRGQENGSVESTQGHLKQRIRQALASLQ